jgi:pimeloyl-ACP methyl ester carboxylesterase
MEDKRIVLDEVELQVRDYEHPGPAVIFLHFSGANLMMWQKAVPYFQDHYRVVLVDLRGHGRSSQPDAGYDMDSMADDLVGVMEKLAINQTHIIGSSMGAEVALGLAANYPNLVTSLVCDGALSSEYGPYSTWEGTQADYEAHILRQLDKMHAAPEAVYPTVDALVEKSRASLEGTGWWNEHVEAMERYGACKLAEGGYVKAFRKVAREDYFTHYFSYRLEDYYRKVQCPLLMVAGEDVLESDSDRAAMLGLSKLAARAQVAELAGWQHPYGWMLDPAEVCQRILSFFASVPG